MGVGIQLKTILRGKGLTIKELSRQSGVSLNTLYSITKRDSDRIDPVIRKQLAQALSVPEYLLMSESEAHAFYKEAFWLKELEEKLRHVGYSVGYDEDDAAIWINYPDGWLEVRESDLRTLNESIEAYMRFKLAELKDKEICHFRPNEK